MCTQAMSKSMLTPWLMMILMCNFSVTLLDPRSFQDGCPAEDTKVPFETKEFNMSEYLDASRAENFIGRQWLYREIEDAFKEEHIAGVQIIGSPGSGKSALTSQLICSRTSSPCIHTHILGYHFCKYSDKNTQMTGRFVRNLAEMIARRLPEYGYLVSNTTYIQRSLNEDCNHYQDPVGCFELAVLSPLRNLKNEPRENWFVVVDALDECLTLGETGNSIVYLLNNKIHRFPPWFKLIVTSRNESDATLYSSKVKKILIDPEDCRNLKDLEIFVLTRFFRETSLLQRIEWWFGDDTVKSITKLAAVVLSKSQGNFLFVKELIDYWKLSRHDLRNSYVLPKTLGDLYQSYFERLYPRKRSFKSARHILELLVSTFEPLTQKEIFELLRMREGILDEEYDFKNALKELGHFLKYGKDNTVTLYHLSLTEWLTSNDNEKFFVSKMKGHEAFCDYYVSVTWNAEKSRVRNKFIFTLAQHIALSGLQEAYVQEFLKFPSQTINSSDPQNNATLLHRAATIDNRGALELLLGHFSCIDCVDDRGITPAFLAAERGLVENLAFLVEKGAKINHKTKTMVAFYKAKILGALQRANDDVYVDIDRFVDLPVYQSKSKFFDASMLHAAAQGGHISVVRFLIQNNVDISMLNGANLNALQIAAENGHLEVVQMLYEAGAVADQTALHHAAANNRLEVLNYLLDIGLKDDCLRCDGSFYWLKGRRRFPSSSFALRPPMKESCSHEEAVLREKKYVKKCFDLEKTWPGETRTLYDDKHLILCHSALHAAVASGHSKVVGRLLSEERNGLNCYDYSGRTPLHETVRKNNSIIVNILLEKQPQMIGYKCKHWQEVNKTLLSLGELGEYYGDVCNCGYTPLHLAVRYEYQELAISLIRNGARVDDQDCTGATPLVTYLHYGGKISDVPLRVFTIFTIECGKPFNYSELHLLSYLTSNFQDNNFFYLEKCIEPTDPLCKVQKGPLAKAIERHSKKQTIISSCFDAEGFTPLHRAAQGGNLVAIRYLLANGADDSILSPHGHDALTLAVLHAGRSRLLEHDKLMLPDADFDHLPKAEEGAIELLHHAMNNRGFKIRCDSSKPDLTLYHIAASGGLVKFIEAIFSEGDWHQLDDDCVNADGITPMYLAKLFEQRVQDGLDNHWEQVIEIIKGHGGKMRYPRKNAEYSIIYNGVYGGIPKKYILDLRLGLGQFISLLMTSSSERDPWIDYGLLFSFKPSD